MKKNILEFYILSVLLFSNNLNSQKIDLEKISKLHKTDKIVNSVRLSLNYAPHVKNVYALFFKDKSVRLYYHENDSISNEVIYNFKSKSNCYLGIIDGFWKIYLESFFIDSTSWKFIGKYPAETFDSIDILSTNEFAAYKDTTTTICYYSFKRFLLQEYKIPFHIKYAPILYDEGIFVVRKFSDVANQFLYLDYKSGIQKIKYSFDSVINFPTPFCKYSLVCYNGKMYVYSFETDNFIEEDFSDFFIVPTYKYPIIFKKNYVALGDSKWIKINIKEPQKIDFSSCGDSVFGNIYNSMNEKYTIDFWGKKMINLEDEEFKKIKLYCPDLNDF